MRPFDKLVQQGINFEEYILFPDDTLILVGLKYSEYGVGSVLRVVLDTHIRDGIITKATNNYIMIAESCLARLLGPLQEDEGYWTAEEEEEPGIIILNSWNYDYDDFDIGEIVEYEKDGILYRGEVLSISGIVENIMKLKLIE